MVVVSVSVVPVAVVSTDVYVAVVVVRSMQRLHDPRGGLQPMQPTNWESNVPSSRAKRL